MKRVKKMTYTGDVLEQEVFWVRDTTAPKDAKPPRPRFASEQEREAHRIGIARRRFVRKFNANFDDTALYSTLTFDAEHEVHTYAEVRAVLDNLWRRLRRVNAGAKIVIVTGRGKSGGRWHLHLVTSGLTERQIECEWENGDVREITPLRKHCFYGSDRVDHGRDYTGLAIYLFNHWTPEQGAHYYKATKNFIMPESEPAREVTRGYDENVAPRVPKGYGLVEVFATDYGYYRYIYVKEPEHKNRAAELAWQNRRIVRNRE